MENMKRYNSAISTWLVIVLALSLGLPLLVTLYQETGLQRQPY
jgi:hypothetical protein